MALADLNSHNGFAPIPGTVHRPTRTSLPPVQGCAPAPVSWVPTVFVEGDVMGASGLTHREDFRRMDEAQRHVAIVKRTTALGLTPKPAADPEPMSIRDRVIAALTAHGHYGDHGCGNGSHVKVVEEDGSVLLSSTLHPAVAANVENLVSRVMA